MEFLVSVICNGFLKLRRRYVPDCQGTHVARIVDSIRGTFRPITFLRRRDAAGVEGLPALTLAAVRQIRRLTWLVGCLGMQDPPKASSNLFLDNHTRERKSSFNLRGSFLGGYPELKPVPSGFPGA